MTNANWWQSATVYQVYVRSWRDANGDGTGDLAGLVEGLDYLAWLGVTCTWLSPTMPSPNADWGYDVSNYTDVHPDLGTLADMDRLVEEAGKRGIAVMLDLVPNHTSDQHPWFLDARTGTEAAHRNYYVWASPRPDGSLPNNWRAATGAPAWDLGPAGSQYYLHNFLPAQPDLNWWEPRVHQEMEEVLEFWFDRGIAGFRIDVAHGLYKDALLRDDPPATELDHPAVQEAGLRPVYSSHRPEVHPIYARWRQLCDKYQPQRALLGETWEFDPQRFADFYGRQEPELHMAFNFTFVLANFDARQLAGVVEETMADLPPGATPVWTASNHDVGRFPSRWCANDQAATRVALLLLASLPGTLVLYYGDEIGMTDVDLPLPCWRDQMTLAHRERPGRDRCRTPMPWSAGANGGFTAPEAVPWLPLGDCSAANVQDQKATPTSLLNFTRHLNELRRSGDIGAVAPLERVWLDDQAWAFATGDNIVAVNLSPRPAIVEAALMTGTRVLAATTPRPEAGPAQARLGLGPWEGLVLRR